MIFWSQNAIKQVIVLFLFNAMVQLIGQKNIKNAIQYNQYNTCQNSKHCESIERNFLLLNRIGTFSVTLSSACDIYSMETVVSPKWKAELRDNHQI